MDPVFRFTGAGRRAAFLLQSGGPQKQGAQLRYFFDVAVSAHDRLSNFTFENLVIDSKNAAIDKSVVKGLTLKNVKVNQARLE